MSDQRQPTFLDRVLRLFADVKAGEGLLAVIFTVNVFLLLGAYYVLKPIRDSLIVNTQLFGIPGDELKSYFSAAMAFLAIPIVGYYAALASKLPRIKLINMTSSFIIGCVVVFFLLLKVVQLDGPGIAIAYFLWLGIVNVFIIAQFWSYTNDIYTEGQGKRLFAIIGIGQSVGAIAGSWFSREFGKEFMYPLLASAAGVLVICQLLYNVSNRRISKRGTSFEQERTKAKEEQPEEPLSKGGGFALISKSKYLLFIALMILIANMVNTTGEYIISNAQRREAVRLYPNAMFTGQWAQLAEARAVTGGDVLEDWENLSALGESVAKPAAQALSAVPIPEEVKKNTMYTSEWVTAVKAGQIKPPQEVVRNGIKVIDGFSASKKAIKKWHKGFGTSFFGGFYFWVNLVGAAIQMFLVSRFFKYFGVRAALFVLPVVATLGAAVFSVIGTLVALRIVKTAENATDYSLQNTLKAALFLPTTREEKYKAKAAIDVFFVRAGDALSAGVVALGVNVLAFGPQQFALFNVFLGAAWLFICIRIFREHKKLVPDDTAAA